MVIGIQVDSSNSEKESIIQKLFSTKINKGAKLSTVSGVQTEMLGTNQWHVGFSGALSPGFVWEYSLSHLTHLWWKLTQEIHEIEFAVIDSMISIPDNRMQGIHRLIQQVSKPQFHVAFCHNWRL